jgi:glycosyltransferase involved in cell wall biosynthesis
MNLFCVVPFYNEEKYLPECLRALCSQTDTNFTLLLVDNCSADRSRSIAKDILKKLKFDSFEIITENQKGTGSAADTGFRYAISKGATHIIRTDADCCVNKNWITEAKKTPSYGDILVLGKLSYQNNDHMARWYDVVCFWLAQSISRLYGYIFWRGRHYKTKFVMGAGNNMLVSGALYEKAGGFPRVPLEVCDDDVVLFDAIRKITPNIYRNNAMLSNSSMRRVRKHGYFKTMLYYWARKYTPPVVDVR